MSKNIYFYWNQIIKEQTIINPRNLLRKKYIYIYNLTEIHKSHKFSQMKFWLFLQNKKSDMASLEIASIQINLKLSWLFLLFGRALKSRLRNYCLNILVGLPVCISAMCFYCNGNDK